MNTMTLPIVTNTAAETAPVKNKHYRVIYRKTGVEGWYPQERIYYFFWRDMTATPFFTYRKAEEHYTGECSISVNTIKA